MAEVGLVRFAGLALEISQAVLPAQRTKFSKRIFTQPQLLAVLCLMRYEDWTFREAEVRLSEHVELRRALRLKSVPDYTTLYRFLARLDGEDVARVMNEIVRRMPGRWRSRATVAVDATGLAQGAVSSYFIRRVEHFGEKQRSWKHWLKWLVVVDVERQLILAQSARQAPWNDCASLPALVAEAHRHTPVGCVLADAEFDSERNHRFCRKQLHAKSIIPAKRFTSRRATGFREQMRVHFPRRRYCRRSLIETVFSTVKRKLSPRAPGRSLATQTRQALLLGAAFNLYRLRPSPLAAGCQQSQRRSKHTSLFWSTLHLIFRCRNRYADALSAVAEWGITASFSSSMRGPACCLSSRSATARASTAIIDPN